MNNKRPSILVPACIGGALAGLLSGIPFLNCLCCLWIIGGAMLASHLLAKDSLVSLTAGDGAIVGIFTGIVAAVVDALIGIPLHAVNSEVARRIMERLAQYTEDMPSGLDAWLEKGAGGVTVSMFFLGLLFSAVVFAAFGALGGIIGASLFGKKKALTPQGPTDATQDPGHRQP
jgi:hypothetical protein